MTQENGDYEAYPRRLFDSMENTALRSDVESVLGPPHTHGDWGGEWILYLFEDQQLHFSFEEDQSTCMVTVSAMSREG